MEEDISEECESKQRLKAALHYTVGNVCSQVEESTFSRELVAIITETTFKQAELLATDLELFAKHAKRTTVSADDVKLCCRRSQSLRDIITAQGEKLRANKETNKEADKEGGGAMCADKEGGQELTEKEGQPDTNATEKKSRGRNRKKA